MLKGKKKEQTKLIFLILFSFVMGGIVMFLIIHFTVLSKSNLTIIKDKTKIYEKKSLSQAVNKIYDAVVVVQNYKGNDSKNTGSGFIYKVDGNYAYIITNEHVISGADTIKIIFTSEEEETGELLGRDEYLDLAVLRIKKDKVKKVASIGSSEDIQIGDTIFTVGTPLGYEYRGSVTAGILSGKDRMVSVSVSNQENADWLMKVLQMDASINPGNSGGPLLNINGEVIGICTMKLTDDDIEGMGFAIPIEYAMNHIDSLEKGKEIEWPTLGINMANVSESSKILAKEIKLPTDIKEGVVILDIKKGTSAASSQLKKGDIITKVNGKKVSDKAELRYELYQHHSGEKVKITYISNGKEKNTKVLLKK